MQILDRIFQFFYPDTFEVLNSLSNKQLRAIQWGATVEDATSHDWEMWQLLALKAGVSVDDAKSHKWKLGQIYALNYGLSVKDAKSYDWTVGQLVAYKYGLTMEEVKSYKWTVEQVLAMDLGGLTSDQAKSYTWTPKEIFALEYGMSIEDAKSNEWNYHRIQCLKNGASIEEALMDKSPKIHLFDHLKHFWEVITGGNVNNHESFWSKYLKPIEEVSDPLKIEAFKFGATFEQAMWHKWTTKEVYAVMIDLTYEQAVTRIWSKSELLSLSKGSPFEKAKVVEPLQMQIVDIFYSAVGDILSLTGLRGFLKEAGLTEAGLVAYENGAGLLDAANLKFYVWSDLQVQALTYGVPLDIALLHEDWTLYKLRALEYGATYIEAINHNWSKSEVNALEHGVGVDLAIKHNWTAVELMALDFGVLPEDAIHYKWDIDSLKLFEEGANAIEIFADELDSSIPIQECELAGTLCSAAEEV